MFCSTDIHILPTDRGFSERIKGKTLRPQTDISKVKVSDVHDHGRRWRTLLSRRPRRAPAGVVQWIEPRACDQKVFSLIPSWFNSQLGHMPGLWARSLVGGAQEATTH